MNITKKSTNNKCWWGCGEKGTLVHCWWECKLAQPLWKAVWSFLKKLKIELAYDPAIPLLGIYSEKIKTLIWKDGTSLEGQWLRLHSSTAGSWVWSLVRQLRSRMPQGAAKKTKKKIHAPQLHPNLHSSTVYNSQDMEAT